jgi:ribosome-associated protein YbcJ (S4-like RNA binding protein)
LERALVKVGSYESGEITLDQFVKLMDIIQNSIDESKLSIDVDDDGDDDKGFASSKKVLRLDDAVDDDEEPWTDDEDVDDDDDEEPVEISEEEAAKEIFNELSKERPVLPLVDFLKWEDVQELMECGALSKDDLAAAIENAGVSVEKGEMNFETVS